VDEIVVAFVTDLTEWTRANNLGPVPTNVWHFDLPAQPVHAAGNKAEPGRITLLLGTKEELETKANTEKWRAIRHFGGNDIVQVQLVQASHCRGGGSDSWEYNRVGSGDNIAVARYGDNGPGSLQRAPD